MTYEYRSDIAQWISGFMKSLEGEKKAKTIGRHMKQLDEYAVSSGHSSGVLDKQLVEGYCVIDMSNEQETKQRASSVRQLAYFIVEHGGIAFIQPTLCLHPKEGRTDIVFTSCLGHWMTSLVTFKQSQMYLYYNEKKFLHCFDVFLAERGYTGDELTQEMAEEYSLRPLSESPKTVANKLSVVRVLGRFIVRNGGKAYILESSGSSVEPRNLPSCYTEAALIQFLDEVDNARYTSRWGKYVFPVYFRLLHLTGMRESECCTILRSDIDYENGRILIRGAKGQKDRYVYVSGFGMEMIRLYDEKMERYLPARKYLFTSLSDITKSLSAVSVRRKFNSIREKAGFDKSLTIHSLRHTYAMDKVVEYEKEGGDVNAKIPYLSKQLGHASIQGTYYYLKRLDTRFSEIINLSASDAIIPEVDHEEE